MKTKSFIVSFIVAFSVSCSSFKRQATADLTGNMLIPYGRCLQGQGGLELISSASHFGFTFTGKACQVTAYLSDAQGHNYLQYEIDGTYEAKKIKIIGDKHQTFTLSVPHEGTHTVWIYKATEAHTGPIYIKHIQGSSLQAIAKPKAPLIEFIGNSITCGAAADPDEVPCGTGAYHDQHNAYQAYGPRLARKLGVHYVLSSVSGIGVYRNWNSEGPTMPQVYEKADFQEQGTRAWDFTRFTPDIVSISLGTNDFSGGDGKKRRLPFDSGSFVNAYVKFVRQVRAKYPQSQIALLSSPIVHKEHLLLENCLEAVKQQVEAQDPKHTVALYFFEPIQASGCTGHPSVEDHAKLAEALHPFFKQLVGK